MGILRRNRSTGTDRPNGPDTPTGPDEELAELAAELVREPRPETTARTGVRRLARSLTRARLSRARPPQVGDEPAASSRSPITDRLLAAAPRIPVRDLATLRRQHAKASTPEELADRLVTGACRATAAIGMGVGAAAVVPTVAITAELAAELLTVAAVEVKLIAELHEVYGHGAPGTALERTTAYLGAWAQRRGIDSMSLLRPSGVLALGAGARVRQQVSRRLARGSLRKLPSLAPFMLGSALGAHLNRRDTLRLAALVRADLRTRPPLSGPDYWEAAAPR
ncbi:hypothetical protein C7C46_23270 [Streptomyces tateyamensis]|uniref:EcsC family protein n=1 Tax=Streptomyces tateyamensis TaxID=565073 RepID=A0A2V4N8T1_9ACTN|nr:hypothetical protein [Streptomyces tateyamensis]PYC75807.1 hypothetical protein C7C46_23270 [Streptomyces tateyamensis]